MNIEINKKLIKDVFPKSRFMQLRRPTISETVIDAKPGDWVWSDGDKLYSRIPAAIHYSRDKSSEVREAIYEVYKHLGQLNKNKASSTGMARVETEA